LWWWLWLRGSFVNGSLMAAAVAAAKAAADFHHFFN